MSAANTLENSILLLLFNNDDFTGIGDAGGLLGSVTPGSLYVSLHTSDPGEGGNQSTNEAAYTSYARVAVARSSSGWTVSSNVAENAAAVTFPKATGGSETATHFGIGTASSGSGKLLFSAALNSNLAISNNIQPSFPAGDLSVTTD